ncbi:hypothetical protein GWI33_022792 [Rhynchophorus ferrugineus]|uniref:Uncharacterized protein n=1 Tax=Rhynchophorus ferrugineus TaxID=354439 RepID=A0A834IS58_RHYFE|nr:hypothetical protein GWI33_022792 [Rhynchophorus ferrugineus]
MKDGDGGKVRFSGFREMELVAAPPPSGDRGERTTGLGTHDSCLSDSAGRLGAAAGAEGQKEKGLRGAAAGGRRGWPGFAGQGDWRVAAKAREGSSTLVASWHRRRCRGCGGGGWSTGCLPSHPYDNDALSS